MGVQHFDLDLTGNGVKLITRRTPINNRNFRPVVYIAGPMTSEGHPYVNIGDAIEVGETAYERGWAPFVPHLDALSSMVTGNKDIKRYLDTDFAVLARCDALCVLPYKVEEKDGMRSGTSLELDLAEELGIPVYTEETLPYVN